MLVYKGVRSCPTKTYYTLTNGSINSNQLYLSLIGYIRNVFYIVIFLTKQLRIYCISIKCCDQLYFSIMVSLYVYTAETNI